MQRPPADTPASLEDFRNSGWRVAACGADEPTYFSRWQGLGTAAAAATQSGDLSKAKILWLLSDACYLRLDPDKRNEPLPGVEKMFGLGDIDNREFALLESIRPEIDDSLLQARVADILWLTRRPRALSDATAAIDAYRATGLDADSWLIHDSQLCWRRAIVLALQIGPSAAGRVADMERSLLEAITTQLDAGLVAPSMIETLLEYRLGSAQYHDLAERLAGQANRLIAGDTSDRFFQGRRYFLLAKRCFAQRRNHDRCADMDCAISDTFAGEAAARLSVEHASYVVAASLYADAVQALLNVPNQLRSQRGIDKKLVDLRRMQRDTAMQSIGDFAPMPSKPLDLEVHRKDIRERLAGKDLTDALLLLAQSWPLASPKLLEEEAHLRMKQGFFSRMFAAEKIASDGRVTAMSRAAGSLVEASPEATAAVWNKMVQDHQFSIRYAVHAIIAAAWEQVVLDHLITQDDLVHIVALSGMVPAERVWLVAKGLKAGFEGDFVVSLHLLIPQLEHIVRTHLQLRGAKTLTSEGTDLQMEAGLSTLASHPEMKVVFGEDLAFEIRALFCEGFGPNLRNEVAHGLIEVGALQSAESIYAWWLIFRTIYLQYWCRQD